MPHPRPGPQREMPVGGVLAATARRLNICPTNSSAAHTSHRASNLSHVGFRAESLAAAANWRTRSGG